MLSLRQMQFVNMLVPGREIERRAAEAARPPGDRLRRQRQANVMHGVLPSREGALASILDEVGFRASGQVVLPLGFKVAPGRLEARRITAPASAAMRWRVEAAVPSPLRGAEWHARLDGDRADLNVAVVDVPAIRA